MRYAEYILALLLWSAVSHAQVIPLSSLQHQLGFGPVTILTGNVFIQTRLPEELKNNLILDMDDYSSLNDLSMDKTVWPEEDNSNHMLDAGKQYDIRKDYHPGNYSIEPDTPDIRLIGLKVATISRNQEILIW